MKRIAIFGAGGFAREVVQWAMDCGLSDLSLVVDDPYHQVNQIRGFPNLPFSKVSVSEYNWLIALGSSERRRDIAQRLGSETEYATLIHPSAVVGRENLIGNGTIIGPHVTITDNVSIGFNTHVHTNSLIGHDSKIGDFVTISPSVSVLGNCIVGSNSVLGSASCIREGIEISENVVVGMGSVVVKNLEVGTFVGNPARRLR